MVDVSRRRNFLCRHRLVNWPLHTLLATEISEASESPKAAFFEVYQNPGPGPDSCTTRKMHMMRIVQMQPRFNHAGECHDAGFKTPTLLHVRDGFIEMPWRLAGVGHFLLIL